MPAEKTAESANNHHGAHLFVLVHGFQGCANDMRMVRNQLFMQNPKANFLSATANENTTDGNIIEMGKRLADEVRKHVRRWYPNQQALGKITFIAHSLGGVIVRSALPWLVDYKDKMWGFVTFSSPHLGYMFSESGIVNAGLWLLKKWYGSECLEQL